MSEYTPLDRKPTMAESSKLEKEYWDKLEQASGDSWRSHEKGVHRSHEELVYRIVGEAALDKGLTEKDREIVFHKARVELEKELRRSQTY